MNKMPYIKELERKKLENNLNLLIDQLKKETKDGTDKNGVVTYAIYKIIMNLYGDGNYEILSNAIKVLESVKLEYYRRVITPYENMKIYENGDI